MLKHKIGGFVIARIDNNYTVTKGEGGKPSYHNNISSACIYVAEHCADQKETLGLWLNEYRRAGAELKELLEVEL